MTLEYPGLIKETLLQVLKMEISIALCLNDHDDVEEYLNSYKRIYKKFVISFPSQNENRHETL